MKGTNIYLIVFLALVVIAGVFSVYIYNQPGTAPSDTPNPSSSINIYCDKSYCVEQSAPFGAGTLAKGCWRSFDECAADWKMLKNTNAGFQFSYPENFGANVWRAYFWPPKALAVPANQDPLPTGCPDYELTQALPSRQVTLSGLNFSVYESNGAGAGSMYSTYCYVTQRNSIFYALEFVVQSHTGCSQGDCGAYCGTQYEQECRDFDLKRDVARPIERIVSTFKFLN